MKLLLIEGKTGYPASLAQVLKKEGYVIEVAQNRDSGVEMALLGSYDLIILDWLFAKLDGVTAIRELREQGLTAPILFLTVNSNIEDKVSALDAGADDYLVQPFSHVELLARLRVLLRRKNKELVESELTAAGLILNSTKCEVIIGENAVELSAKETLLLEILMRNCGHVDITFLNSYLEILIQAPLL